MGIEMMEIENQLYEIMEVWMKKEG
jgi:hypothetical protein